MNIDNFNYSDYTIYPINKVEQVTLLINATFYTIEVDNNHSFFLRDESRRFDYLIPDQKTLSNGLFEAN